MGDGEDVVVADIGTANLKTKYKLSYYKYFFYNGSNVSGGLNGWMA